MVMASLHRLNSILHMGRGPDRSLRGARSRPQKYIALPMFDWNDLRHFLRGRASRRHTLAAGRALGLGQSTVQRRLVENWSASSDASWCSVSRLAVIELTRVHGQEMFPMQAH